ncbi:MAG: SEC-C domain-containing protein, partial [Clostridia bacterium]|nr:SEC-C domain-containing protein [Clostridia bacterium]
YDDVMNQQRKVIYAQRREVLFEDSIEDTIKKMIEGSVSAMFELCFGSENPEEWNFREFVSHYYGHLVDSHGFNYTPEELKNIDKDAWRQELIDEALRIWRSKDELFRDTPERSMRELEKKLLLMTVDMKWMDHLEALDELREYVGLNAYAQRDPVSIYRLESSEMFDAMIDEIKEETVQKILSVDIRRESTQREQVAKVTSEGFVGGEKKVARKPVKAAVTVGRNDPCPCGSGKKYKRCCGLND